MDYTRNCSITKIAFRKNVDNIILIPTFFRENIELTSNIDSLVIQLPYINHCKYNRYGMFSFTDNDDNRASLTIINSLLNDNNFYNWMDLHEFCKSGLFTIDGNDYILDMFAIHEEIYNEIINSYSICIEDKLLNYNDFETYFISNFNQDNYSEKYISKNFYSKEIKNISKLEFIKDFMIQTGISIQPSFFVREYKEELYKLINRATIKILNK